MGKGIDYGMGQTNIDKKTGIRFGVININRLRDFAFDEFESVYGENACPKCGEEVVEAEEGVMWVSEEWRGSVTAPATWYCKRCEKGWREDDVTPDEPVGWKVDDGEYFATMSSDNDVFVEKSPYKTRAAFCSPCAPGACYLTSPDDEGEWAYCFGPDWFDKESPMPYPCYRVDTGELVNSHLCPVCGEFISLKDELTKDGRLIGSCGDTFTQQQWDANADGEVE